MGACVTNAELSLLAARYATAALNVWQKPLSISVCKTLEQLILFFKENKSLLFFLQLPLFSYEQKKEVLIQVRTRYELPECFDQINMLLLTHQRTVILLLVYAQLIEQSQKRMGIAPCAVTTAQELSVLQQETCTLFVQKMCTKKPLITWYVDPTLIAGMRIKTAEELWEHSLDARLRVIANTILI